MRPRYAVMNFLPRFCPGCGKALHFSVYAEQDWNAGAGQACACGANYQLAPLEAVLDAAEKHPHGDLKRYAQQEGWIK